MDLPGDYLEGRAVSFLQRQCAAIKSDKREIEEEKKMNHLTMQE